MRARLVGRYLSGVAVFVWAAAASAGWYQDASRSYYVDVPETWVARSRTSDTERVLALASPDGAAAVRIHVLPVEPPLRLDALKGTFETTVVPGVKQLAAAPSSQSGQQAIEAQYAWAAGGAGWSVTGRFLFAEKFGRSQGYLVWSMTRDGAPALRIAEAGRLLDSFSLLRPRGAFEVGTALPDAAAPAAEAAFLLGDLKGEPAPRQAKPEPVAQTAARPEPAAPAPTAQPAASPAPAQPAVSPPTSQPTPSAPTAQPAVSATPAQPAAPAEPQREAGFLPPQRSAPAERPGGPSKCLDATGAVDCGCALGNLRPAFADLEQAFVKVSPASGELRDAATKIRDETASSGGSCPPAAVNRATALAERLGAPEAVWIADRLELLKVCSDRAIARITEQRGRPGLNRTLDAAVDETRMVKYDALLLLAEFERLRAERDTASALLGEVLTGCRIVQGTR